MARLAMINKNNDRREKALRYMAYRKELREKMVNQKISPEERYEAQLKLQKLRKNTSILKVTNRCHLTGRAKGNLKKFMLSRIKFRELANRGLIPGVTKASW